MMAIPYFARTLLHTYRLRHRFKRSVIHHGVKVDSESSLGDWSVLFPNARLTNSSLGAYSYVQKNSTLNAADVGPFCSIAANVAIGLPNHPVFMVSTSPVFYDDTQPLPRFLIEEGRYPTKIPRTIIEADVWIGDGAKLMAGVRVGAGAVIGSGAVVTKDVQPYTIAGGVPCRPLKHRFESDVCSLLLDSRWWELDESILCRLAPYFASPLIFLSELKKISKNLPLTKSSALKEEK